MTTLKKMCEDDYAVTTVGT